MSGTYVLTVHLGFQTEGDRDEVTWRYLNSASVPCRRKPEPLRRCRCSPCRRSLPLGRLGPPQLLAAFRPLAEHVRANEEGTITYQWLQSDSDPLKCLILERCGCWCREARSCPPRPCCRLRVLAGCAVSG